MLYEGSPDVPDPTRLWQLVERHGITMLGVSPTLARTLRSAGAEPTHDLSSVRIIGSTGEPWDPESYEWLARDVFGGRVPVINFSGGTEVGGSFLVPVPGRRDRAAVRWAGRRSAWTSTSSTTRRGRSAARSASWCAGSRGRR